MNLAGGRKNIYRPPHIVFFYPYLFMCQEYAPTLSSLSCRQVIARPGLGALARGLQLHHRHDRLHQRDHAGADWGQVVVRAAAARVRQGAQGAALHCHAQEALVKVHGSVFVLNLVLLKVPEIDLMRGVVVCAVRRPLCLAQCGRPTGVGKATARHGVGFHGAVTASMAR
jgi:hypothetical protein